MQSWAGTSLAQAQIAGSVSIGGVCQKNLKAEIYGFKIVTFSNSGPEAVNPPD